MTTVEERKERALRLFNEGYNCAQAVFLAYSDVTGLDDETAKKLSAPFGGGMGQMHEVCGTVSAMSMLMGLKYPFIAPEKQGDKTACYAAVKRCAAPFKDKFGTVICRDLLKIASSLQPKYEHRPCSHFVAEAVEILGKEL